MNEGMLKSFLLQYGCECLLNSPHSSRFGGVWERQIIAAICRVLDAILLELGKHQPTNELLVTLLAEVSATVNARPITPISSDANDPRVLSLLH